MIKDSGNRTAFSTGAVRDMQDNKGRCDLLPLDEVQSVLEDKNDILDYLESYKRTEDTEFLEFVQRQFASIAYDGDRIGMILDVAEHYAEGAEKYGVDN